MEIVIAVCIHILVPASGVVLFVNLCRRMREASVPDPPFIQLFILFFTYGGLLLVLLTAMFWKWSGMASLGVGYLAIIAPFVLIVSLAGFPKQNSGYHRATFLAAIVYLLIAGLSWVAFMLSRH